MSRPPWVQGIRMILTVTLVPLWVGCDGDPVEPPEPTTIAISPSSATLHSIDDTVQLSAFVHDQNGQVMPEVQIWWASSETSVAAINTTGMVTAARNGRVAVIASVGAVSATAEITVAQEVAEVRVSPSADTLVALKDTVRLVGQARDANGHLIEGANFNWSSTDAMVASVDISGLVTAARDGRATVIAQAGAVSANVEILVEQEVAEVTVSPSADTLFAFGDTVRLTAEASDANGHEIEGLTFSWRSSNPRVVVVNTSGLLTAARNGRVAVIASVGPVSATAEITVAQEVAEVRVSPSGVTLVALEDTVRLVGEARDANGHLIEGARFNWSSTDASVASLDITGLVTAARNGRAAVIARAGAVSASVEVLVEQEVAAVTVSPSADTLVAFGDTVRLAAEARDANQHVVEEAAFNWASSHSQVAMVDITGLVTAVGNGMATVTVSDGALLALAEILVEQEVASVRVSPSADTLVAIGDTVRLLAEARDANEHVVAEAEFAWSSDDASVATVDAAGRVTAAANGAATISATAAEVSGSAAVTVAQVVRTVRVSPAADSLLKGESLRLSAAAGDANGHAVVGAEFAWASGDPLVAVVDDLGLVTGVREGTVEIRAISSGVSGAALVTVRTTPLGVPAEIAVVVGDGQEVVVGTAVPIPPAVLVTDSAGTPLPGVTVTFLAGGGTTISGGEATTDTLGHAAVGSWTLGTTAGLYRLRASVDADGVRGNPAFIEARTVPGTRLRNRHRRGGQPAVRAKDAGACKSEDPSARLLCKRHRGAERVVFAAAMAASLFLRRPRRTRVASLSLTGGFWAPRPDCIASRPTSATGTSRLGWSASARPPRPPSTTS